MKRVVTSLASFVFLVSTSCFAAAPPSPRLAYFCATYDTCRAAFLAAAKPWTAEGGKLGKLRIPSRVDQDLTTDYLYLPATRETRTLLILSSGVHGVEGFGGSSVQQYFFKEVLPKLDRDHLGILVIHAVNPFGMKYLRRVSENNVDLNRNFDVNRGLFSTPNEGYAKLENILNPQKPVVSGPFSYAGFLARIVKLLAKEPLKTLRQAILQGQYQYPKGIYYGGQEFEPQQKLLEPLLLEVAKPYKNVLALDLHTGYGTRGVLHLFPTTGHNKDVTEASAKLFAGFKIEDPHGDEFYDNFGDFSTWESNLLVNEGKVAVPMCFEYGTFDNQGYVKGIESLHRMINENQMYWYGAASPKARRRVQKHMIELYFPSAAKWREQVMEESVKALPVVVDRLNAF